MPATLTTDETLQYLAVFLNEWIPAKRIELESLQARWEKSREREAAKPTKPAQGFLEMAFGEQAAQVTQSPPEPAPKSISATEADALIAQNAPEPAKQIEDDAPDVVESPVNELPTPDDELPVDDVPPVSARPIVSDDDDENLV